MKTIADKPEVHQHSLEREGGWKATAHGYLLLTGARILPTDVYAASDGLWKPLDPYPPKPAFVDRSTGVVWVRPV